LVLLTRSIKKILGTGRRVMTGNVMSLTGWGVLLVVAVAVVAAIVLIIRLIVRHTRGYD
jgi:hypothetical protein